jgi:hypothetical protein
MSRYPRAAREAAIKCIPCNAPVTETVEGEYIPVECGDSPVTTRSRDAEAQRIAADD